MAIKNTIKDMINNNEVCLFMKGTPDSPQCGFSMTVSNILKHLKVNFKGINVLEDENLRQGIKDFSDWPTIPQLYVKGEFVGGCDIVKEMFEKEELKKFLIEKEIIKFSKMSKQEVHDWYWSMEDILVHNFNLFMEYGKNREQNYKNLFKELK